MKRLCILLAITCLRLCAACHVMTNVGGGTNSGADWNNPCNGFSGNCAGSALVHGDTYYLAGGSGSGYYGPSTFPGLVQITSTGTNTGLALTIKAATIADHCTATGFNSATMAVDGGAGQAILRADYTAIIIVSTPNVTIDGNAGLSDASSSWTNPAHACGGTQCGIQVYAQTLSAFQQNHTALNSIAIDYNISGTTVKSVEWYSCYANLCNNTAAVQFVVAATSPYAVQNTTIEHCYAHDWTGSVFTFNTSTATVIEYNYFYKNISNAFHGTVYSVSGPTSNDVFAFNAVQDAGGTSVFDILNAGTAFTFSNEQMYGNLIWTTNGNPNSQSGFGEGIFACINSNVCTGAKVYNNTTVNMQSGTTEGVSFVNAGSGSDVTVYNNLWYIDHTGVTTCAAGVTCTTDYGWYDNTTPHTTGAHDQTSSSNPFVNWTANTTAGFKLSSDTNAWISLSSPYNVDMNGVTRTSSRGALQFVVGSGIAGAPSRAIWIAF